MMRIVLLALGLLTMPSMTWGRAPSQDVGPPASSVSAEPEKQVGRAERIAWWREARFGMFLHWGPVSLTGLEIS
jgi:alpha-L-fucosidase